MLPEEVHRLVQSLPTYGDYLQLPDYLREAINREQRRIGRKPLNPQPLTLTGDDWRKAWADAHDKATDKALDAVY